MSNSIDPIKGAKITLVRGEIADSPVDPASTQPGVISTAYLEMALQRERARATAAPPPGPSVFTDAGGRFAFPNVSPGQYTIVIERDGYFGPERRDGSYRSAATTRITVAAGQPAPDLPLTMIRGGLIAGRVTDPSGRPAANIAVAPYQTIYREGRLALIATTGSVTSDDRGAYRIAGLAPGNYYVAAVPPPPSTVPNPRDSWSRTFCPSITDPASAVLFAVKANTEVLSADIALRATGAFKIGGIAVNPLPLSTAANATPDISVPSFLLVPKGPLIDETVSYQFQNIASDERRRNGEFEIRAPEGLYDLYPQATMITVDRQIRNGSGRTSVEVRGIDRTGVQVNVKSGTDVSGQIMVTGEPTSLNANALRLTLRPLDNIPASLLSRIGPQPVGSSGAFVLRGVPDGRYTLNVSPLPSNAYVSDIRDGDLSVFDSGIEVVRNPLNALKVVIGTNAQIIEGVVVGADGRPAADATIALIPPAGRRQNPLLYNSATSDASGKFRIAAPPGDHKLLAWEAVQPTAWMNEQFVAKYEDQGISVNVTTVGIAGIQIPIIAKGQ